MFRNSTISFAYTHFLFPKGLAVEANAQSLTELRNREQSNQHKIDVEVAAANDSKAKLQGKVIKITAKAGNNGKLFGSVTSKDIADALAAQHNIKLDKRWFDLKDGIKNVGTQQVNIWLHPKVNAKVKVTVEAE